MGGWGRFSVVFTALLFPCLHAQLFNRTFVSDQLMESCVLSVSTLYFNSESTVGIIHARDLNASRENTTPGSFTRELHASALWSMINLESRKCPVACLYRDHALTSNESVARVDNFIVSGNAEGVVYFAENCDIRILCSEKSRFVVVLDAEGVDEVLNAFRSLDKLDVIVLVRNAQSVDIYSLFPSADSVGYFFSRRFQVRYSVTMRALS